MSAQDEAVARAALRRGLLGMERVRQAQERAKAEGEPLVQALATGRFLSAAAVAALLRELATTPHRCTGCGAQASWDQLAGLPALLCPRCAGSLEPAGAGRTSGAVAQPPAPRGADIADYVSEDATESGSGDGSARAGDRSGGAASTPPRAGSGSVPVPLPRDDDPEARRTIGGYALDRELGRGSNGVVWLARREGGGPPVALKALKDDDADEETVKRFELEAAIARKLRHPGLVGVLDAGEDRGRRWLVMEFAPGRTLKEVVVAGKTPPAKAARLVREVADAMALAHSKGVLHRDLKPANIILDAETGKPRVTDFGLARDRSLLRSMTRSGDVIGTPFYMSPEQLRGKRDIDARVDVWSLGVLLYELVVGRRPFEANSFVELVKTVDAGRYPAPSALVQVPRAFDDLIARTLAVDPAERLADAGELKDALDELLPRLEGSTGATGAWPGAARRLLAPGLAGLAVGLSALALALLARGRGGAVAPPSGTEPPAPAPAAQALSAGEREKVRAAIEATLTRPPDAATDALAALRERAAGDPGLRRPLERAEAHAAARAALARALAAAARRDGRAAAAALEESRGAARTSEDAGLQAAIALETAREAARCGRLEAALEALDAPGAPERLGGALPDPKAQLRLEASAILLRGLVLERLGRLDAARVALEGAGRSRATGAAPFVARAARARLAGEKGGAPLAVRALGEEAGDPAALLEAARCQLDDGDVAAARATLADLVRVAPGEPLADVLLARVGLLDGDHAAVAAALERALAACPAEAPEPEALAVRASSRIASGDLPGAQADVDRLLARSATSIDGLLLKGHLLELDRKPDLAEGPRQQAWVLSGKRLARCDRLLAPIGPEAPRAFRKAVGAVEPERPPDPGPGPGPRPTPTEAAPSLAEQLFGKEYADEVRLQQERNLIAGCYQKPRLEGSAPAAMAKALDARAAAATSDKELRVDLRRALETAALGRSWSDLRFFLDRAANFAGDQVGVQLLRARLLLARDRTAEARATLDQLRTLGLPAGEQALLEGELAWREGRHGAALAAFDRAAQAGDGLPARQARAAAALLRLDAPRARALAKEALALDAEHTPSLLLLAAACLHEQALGEAGQALDLVTRLEGSLDTRACALRFALAADRNLAQAVKLKAELVAAPLLTLGDGPGARLLAADLLAAAPAPNGPLLAQALLVAARAIDPDRADLALLTARVGLVGEAPREAVLDAWRAARAAEASAPIPVLDRERFRRRYKQEPPE